MTLTETDDSRVVNLESLAHLVLESAIDTTRRRHDVILSTVIGVVIKIVIESRREIRGSIHLRQAIGKTWIAGETIVMDHLGIWIGYAILMFRRWTYEWEETIEMLRRLDAPEKVGTVHNVKGEVIAAGDINGVLPKAAAGEEDAVRLEMVVLMIEMLHRWDGVHHEMVVVVIGMILL